MKQLIGAFTMDTIIQIGFGVKTNSLIDPDNPITKHAKMAFSTNLTFENTFSFMMIFLAPRLAKLLGLRVNRVPVNFFHKLALEIIKKKRVQLASRKPGERSTATNFIELLLESEVEQKELDQESGQKQQKFITNDEIVAQSVLLYIVGL
jgi:hypothetical protein